MPAGLTFFCAKYRPAREDFTIGHCPCFSIQLTGLAKISFLVKIVSFKKFGCAFRCRIGQNRRVHLDKAFIVKEFKRGANHFVTNLLNRKFDQPVFVLNYPKAIKPFYMLTDPEDEQQYVCADMLAPEGYGEIIGGSERETDYDKLKAAIEKAGLDLDEYEWYLDLRKYGSVPHSGFGLGLERAITWIDPIKS